MSKYTGPNTLDKVIQLVKNAISSKVDKVNGKGLSTNDFTTADKNKLDGLATVATSGSFNDLSDQPTIPTDNNQLANGAGYQTSSDVQSAIRSAIGGIYVPQGTVTFAQLPSPAADKLGYVYNVSDAFTTTGSFLEGAGKSYGAGSNVVCVLHGGIYLWDVLGGTFDLEEITAAEVQALWDSN